MIKKQGVTLDAKCHVLLKIRPYRMQRHICLTQLLIKQIPLFTLWLHVSA
jgi:hypothetical protein